MEIGTTAPIAAQRWTAKGSVIMSDIKIGDTVVCVHSDYYGLQGVVIKQYYPTAREHQTMIETTDGRAFHAPTRDFERIGK